MNLTVHDLLRQDARIQDLYFNISEMEVSITSLYIISGAPKYDIIWTENSDVIDSFISVILEYESSVIWSLTEKPKAVLFTPQNSVLNGERFSLKSFALKNISIYNKNQNHTCNKQIAVIPRTLPV